MAPNQGSHSPAPPGPDPKIDVVQLAERVYRLMCAEARLDRARGVQRAPE